MIDAMATAAAVFEPEEAAILADAVQEALKRLDGSTAALPTVRVEMARLVHNLGRSRLRLKKPITDASHAAEIADDAVELFSYIEEAPEFVRSATRSSMSHLVYPDRVVGAFPTSFRRLPVNRL